MPEMTETLRLRVPERLLKALNREAHRRMLTTSAYVRLILAEHTGLIEPPNVLVDTRAPYDAQEESPCTP